MNLQTAAPRKPAFTWRDGEAYPTMEQWQPAQALPGRAPTDTATPSTTAKWCSQKIWADPGKVAHSSGSQWRTTQIFASSQPAQAGAPQSQPGAAAAPPLLVPGWDPLQIQQLALLQQVQQIQAQAMAQQALTSASSKEGGGARAHEPKPQQRSVAASGIKKVWLNRSRQPQSGRADGTPDDGWLGGALAELKGAERAPPGTQEAVAPAAAEVESEPQACPQ